MISHNQQQDNGHISQQVVILNPRNNNDSNNNDNDNRNNNDKYNKDSNFNYKQTNQVPILPNPTRQQHNFTSTSLQKRFSPHNSRFAALRTSPALADTSKTISFATLNVRGISVQSKFDALFDDIINESISIIGLQETRLAETTATTMFSDHIARKAKVHTHRAYWSFDRNDRYGGVGLIVSSYISTYVQKIHCYHSRFIAIDLFLLARKLKVINIYCHQQNDFPSKGKTFNNYVINHIKQAERDNFKVIIMGDFNADPHVYMQSLINGNRPHAYFSLIDFLHEHNYIDQHPKNESQLEFATHYVNQRPTSRIDLIWYPDDFISNEYCFDRVWQPPFTQLSSDNSHNLDHCCVILYFTKHLLVGFLPLHKKKQKMKWRSYFDVKKASTKEWDDFS